jgi:hypothetical protein
LPTSRSRAATDATPASCAASPASSSSSWTIGASTRSTPEPAAGPGVVAFFGDVNALDSTAKKPQLLLAYFAPCLVAGSLIVILWGCFIGIGRSFARLKKEDYGYATGDALGDYFFYGYRYYRARAAAAKEHRTARFHAAYRRQLTYSIAAAGAVAGVGEATFEDRVRIAKIILQCVSAVIKSYHNDEENSNRFRSNLMLAFPCDDLYRAELVFVGEDRNRVINCLKLITYDTDEAQPTIVLPLSDTLNNALPGAPTAFLHPDGIDVIDDTSKITYRPAVSLQLQSDITAYFNENPFKSFGSVRIIAGGATVGVVNVDARVTHVFGQSADEHKRIAEYLLPFCTTVRRAA